MKLKKLRIMHIVTQLELGGAQNNVLDILRLLDKDRYTVYLASSDQGPLAKKAQRLPGVKTVFLSSLTRPINPVLDLLTLFKLITLFKKERINLVHTHSSKAGILGRWAARIAAVPIIVHTVHGWSFHEHLNFLTKSFYRFLERMTAKFTDQLISVSYSDINKGLSNSITTENKYTLIRYGIETNQFSNCDIDIKQKKKQLGLSQDAPIVGMVACLKPQKSPQDFVRAAALVLKKNPQTQFLLIGDGILRKKVERAVYDLNLQANFFLTGWREDIPEIMRCLDLLVLSSLWEGSPRVFLEAMSSKLPIVAYNVDGVNEVIKDGRNGFLVQPQDTAGLAAGVNRLLGDQDLLKKMGESGLELVMNNGYHAERMLQDLDNLYCSLAAKE
ncbi:glycosyltransferase family 4 protein [Candidatus Omnitrophota bacterium]